MAQDNKVNNLIINKLTKEQYQALENKSNTEIYEITDSAHFTESEINESLDKKQDKLTAGTGIEILPDGTINNTQTSAEWGKITGLISDQYDLQYEFDTKVDKEDGKSLISDTEIERLSTLKNYDDTEVKGLISDLQESKQDKLTAGENISILQQDDNLVISAILDNVSADNTTIQNNSGVLSAIGTKTKSDGVLYNWVGTLEQYSTDISNGKIDENTQCLITDDEQELFASVDLEIPTKLSELANDVNFVDTTQLSTKQDKLTAGENIIIENNIISSVQTGAKWGNISGALNAQTDLKEKFDTKVDKEYGKSLISDTEIERLSTLQNYDDTEIKNSISNLQENKANIDLDNLTQNGEKHFLNKTQITNCILEKPYNFVYAFINNELILKSGNTVIKPNGFEEDGVTKKFERIVLNTDISNKFTGSNSRVLVFPVLNDPDNGPSLEPYIQGGNIFVSDTQPTTTVTDSVWYDTANNIIKNTNDMGVTWKTSDEFCLPVFDAQLKVDMGYTGIYSVLDSITYIGNTIIVYGGLNGLSADGNNLDGTISNEKLIIKTDLIRDISSYGNTSHKLFLISNKNTQNWRIGGRSLFSQWFEQETQPTGTDWTWYNTKTREWKSCDSSVISDVNVLPLATFNKTSSGITEFYTDQTVEFLKRSNKGEITGWGFPSGKYDNLSLGASDAPYTAFADGYVSIEKNVGTSNTSFIRIINTSKGYSLNGFTSGNSELNIRLFLPVPKGDTYTVQYTTTGPTLQFRFYYAEGATND